jgi:multidrug efflux pump subunit AcrB
MVEAGIAGRDLGSTAADVRTLLANRPHERGLRFELAGQVEAQARAFKNLVTVISLAIGLVLLVLVVQFRSFRLPLVVLLAVPYALVGGLLALRLMNLPLDVSGLMGLVMLVGLVVKNGIILLEYTAQVREEGEPTLLGALLRASRVRLRPILITSLTTVVALLPLAFGIGTGSEIQRPLAVAIIGGLLVSTVMTLLVVPTAHLLVGEPSADGRAGAAS